MAKIFTRYLYDLAHIKYSLLNTLITTPKCDFKQVLFYASELYYSGHTKLLCDLLWKVYYDFYIVYYPKFESMMNISYKKFQKTRDKKALITILYNLYLFEPYEGLFILSRCVKQTSVKQKKIQWEDWMQNYNIKQKKHSKYELGLAKSLEEGNILHSIGFARALFEVKPRRCINIVEKKIEKSIKFFTSYKLEKIIAEIYFYFDKKTEKTKPKQSIFKKIKGGEYLTYFVATNFIMPYRNWQVLKKKRRYKVSKEIGCFSDVHSQTKFDLINNWMKYAIHSEYWQKILEKYDGSYDEEKDKFVFKTDAQKTEFESKYEFEIDEQSQKIIAKSLYKVTELSLFDWLAKLFWNNNEDGSYNHCMGHLKNKLIY